VTASETGVRPSPTTRPRRLKGDEIYILRRLALDGADRAPIMVTSGELGERVGFSQQAADRYLVDLAKRGLIVRALSARRQRVELTPAALELLQGEYHLYRRLFEGPSRVRFDGSVASGLGEGRYYLSQPGYVLQFAERLGYRPYPGTLNVRLEGDALRTAGLLKHWTGVRIDGFEASGRSFGGAQCFRARLNGHDCHLIHPDRTHYRDVVEFISSDCLREALGLVDGARVAIELEES
jgi:riboflavin kinase